MRLADYVADWIASLDTRVYAVCGAGAMHLNDAICNHPGIRAIAMHHEQAATFAAEADARVTNKPAVVHVTAGPGGTNTITGVASAWVDSIPLIVIAGQVTSSTLKRGSGVRQLGNNELDLVTMMGSITKYAVTVFDATMIRQHLEAALYLATHDRPGPVFIEIPLDVQAAEIDPEQLQGYQPPRSTAENGLALKVAATIDLINQSSRPIFFVGNGIHLSGAEDAFANFLCCVKIPIVSSWNASDLVTTDYPLYIGRPGIMGDRAGNFAVQNADLVLAIGTRLSIPQIGHATHRFAAGAKLIVVDVDRAEASKPTLNIDIPIVADARVFLNEISFQSGKIKRRHGDWAARCEAWKKRYPVMVPEHRELGDGINSYFFAEVLGNCLDSDAVVVTDVGYGFLSTMQSLRLRGRQRLFHSGGVSAMGYGFPAAIGAAFAGSLRRQTVCLTGDGGFMLNLQELQTIAHHRLPVAIFVYVNGAYKTMQLTQNHHFRREALASPQSGISCPDFVEVARAFGIPAVTVNSHCALGDWVHDALSYAKQGPYLVALKMATDQALMPRVMSRVENGKFVSAALEDMWPYLDRDELAENMVGENAQALAS